MVDDVLAFCPDPQLARLGLTEILLNAVEHGNLGFSYADKAAAIDAGTWPGDLETRRATPEYRNRVAQLSVFKTDYAMLFLVCDEGHGFDWHAYLELDPSRVTDANGRGIALARQLSFNRLDYAGDGSVVLGAIDIPFSSLETRRRRGCPKHDC